MSYQEKMHHHHELAHIKSSEMLRDFVIGMADGLTVPFALVAGLSGVFDKSNIIVIAGVAEIAAGTIAMGLGGYLAARTQREHYEAELTREEMEIIKFPEIESQEVKSILEEWGISAKDSPTIVNALKKDPEKWRDFMMRFELGLDKPNKNRELTSPIIIGSAYAIGGFVPLFPYFFTDHVNLAFNASIILTIISLLAFGAFKGAFTGVNMIRSALHTCAIGGFAASAAYFLAKLVS